MLVFPRDFKERLLRSMARRSAYIRDHFELLGEADLELPAETTGLWIEGMLLTSDDLRATEHSILTDYLKVCASAAWRTLVGRFLHDL